MKEKILALYSEGKSYREIASILGCSKGTISYHCGAGQKDKTRQRQRDRRSKNMKHVQEYKQNHGCSDCKEDYPYWILELDHVRGTKIGNLSVMVKQNTLEEVIAELEKCDVVCSNCHRNRTWNRIVSSDSSTMDLVEFYT